MKTLTKAQVFQHMDENVRVGKSPGEGLEYYVPGGKWSGVLIISPLRAFLNDDTLFRIKPRTHTINSYEVPAPETEAPAMDAAYWCLHPLVRNGVYFSTWDGFETDQNALRNGLWLSKEDAIANAKALRGEDPFMEGE